MLYQKLPEFEVDFSQWKNVLVQAANNPNAFSIIGFIYKDVDYAERFFNHIKQWNHGESQDLGNIILSIIEEKNETYTYYIYSDLANLIDRENEIRELDETTAAGMTYYRNCSYVDYSFIHEFLKTHPQNKELLLCPAIKAPPMPGLKDGQVVFGLFKTNDGKIILNGYELLIESQIILKGYKFKKRMDLNEKDIEYHLPAVK